VPEDSADHRRVLDTGDHPDLAPALLGESSFRAPMAIAVIGGLVTSTALTLVMVPAIFTLVDDLGRRPAPRAARILAPGAAPVSGLESS